MRVSFLTIGRFKSAEAGALLESYLKLANRYASTERVELAGTDQDAALESWLGKRGTRICLWLLDERGRCFTSRELATRVEKVRDSSLTDWVIAVGGPHGYGEELRASAQFVWSLSPLTLPHELAAAVAAEQLFRALSILAGHPYHND